MFLLVTRSSNNVVRGNVYTKMGGAKSRVEPIFISPSEDSDRLTELQRQLAESRESEKAAELSAKAANTTVCSLQ